MRIALIGSGFAALGVAYFLSRVSGIEVTLFEKEYVGAGASGAACGLLHPYPGLTARRSYHATEALQVTKELIRFAEAHTPKKVAQQNGIFRRSLDAKQHQTLIENGKKWGDIEQVESDLFLIHSGITVDSRNYLEGLTQGLKKRGVHWVFKEIQMLDELEGYDVVVIAAGYGIKQFVELGPLPLKYLKGQALQMEGSPLRERSFIAKGYLAHMGERKRFEVGATYEREFEDASPALEQARALLQDKLALCKGAKIVGCKAGVRVCPLHHHLPLIKEIKENLYLFTGLGSRGLLYHGFYGRKLTQTLLSKNRIFS